MKKIFFITSIISILFFAVSCEQERVIYDPGSRVEASFPSNIVRYSMTPEDNNQFTVEMWRGNTNSAVSVPVTITGATSTFTPEKSQFDFAAGENKAYLKFTYDNLNNFGGETYNISITITDPEHVSYGGTKTLAVSAQRRLTFQSLGTGYFYSEFFDEGWPQPVQKALEAEYFRLPNCYYNGYHIEFSVTDGSIVFAKQPMGYVHSVYGMVSWTPTYLSYCEINGKNYTFVVDFRVDAGSFGGYYEELTMP